MTIEEVRALCNGVKERDCRNIELCKDLSPIDEGFVYHIDRDILNHSPKRSALENIDDILNDEEGALWITDQSRKTAWYNSYPYGGETDIVYSRFLGICRGKARLDTVLKEALQHSEAVTKFCSQHSDKTTVILTDKWEVKTFAKYEKAFVRYACKHGIFPIFLLVTDYGYTQIPFLPNNRDKVRELILDMDIDKNEALMLFNDLPAEYIEQGGTFNIGQRNEYIFRFADRIWELNHVYAESGIIRGTIPDKATKQFFKEVQWIACTDDKELETGIHSFDADRYEISVFGKRLFWDASTVDKYGDPRYIKLSKAIQKLIDSLEE